MKKWHEKIIKTRLAMWPLERWFLLIGGVLGLLFILILPVGQAPDDIMHFQRAYGITEGALVPSLIGENGEIGSAVPADVEEVLEKMPENGHYAELLSELGEGVAEKTDGAYNNAALYNFVCYIPQALAIMIGKLFSLSTAWLAYLARVFNFILWMVLVYFAIKMIPRFKKIVLFIALLPITLQEATSLAPDALTIGLGIYMISSVLHLAYDKKKLLKTGEIILLYVMAMVMGFCKIVYLPLMLLYLIIPDDRFGSKRKKMIHLGIIWCVTAMLNLGWLMISSGFLMEFNPRVNSKDQVLWVLAHPFDYVITIVRTVAVNMELWMSNMLGMNLGAFAFNLPNVMFLMSFAIFVVLFMQRDETLVLRRFDRLICVGVFAAIVLLIFTSLYVQWTEVGASIIDGIQGRYFLPILLLVPVIFCRGKNIRPHATLVSSKIIMCYSIIVNIVALITIFMQNK